MHRIKTGIFAFTLAAVMAAAPAMAASKAPPDGEQFVSLFNKIYGAYPGFRANHAKGIMVQGTFTPTKQAANLSRAQQFQGPVPVIVRFSSSGGVPTVADNDPSAEPKGMAVKFKLPDGTDTDIVCISADGFPAGTPQGFYDFLTAKSKSGPKTPHPTPLETYIHTHPAAQHFVAQLKNPPVSFATEPYYGVDAFRFANADDSAHYIRYFIEPVAKVAYLSPAAAAKAKPNYLEDDLKARLKKGPILFRLVVKLAKEGDPIDDGTKLWPKTNPKVVLGTIKITKLVKDEVLSQREILFTPVNVTDGISVSADPLIPARGDAYAVSYSMRAE